MRPRAETRWDRRDSVACWRAAVFLSRSACLLRALTSSLEWFLCLRVLTLLRSFRCSSTSIIHQAGEGTMRLGLCQLSTCLPPGVAPGPKASIYTLAQIRPLHCTISSLALRHSAIIDHYQCDLQTGRCVLELIISRSLWSVHYTPCSNNNKLTRCKYPSYIWETKALQRMRWIKQYQLIVLMLMTVLQLFSECKLMLVTQSLSVVSRNVYPSCVVLNKFVCKTYIQYITT